METIILKIILCSGIVLGLYYLFLAKEKTFNFNRFYLLLGLVFSYSIPFVTIETQQIEDQKPTIIFEQEIPQQVLQAPITSQTEVFDYVQLLWIFYFIISGILILKLLYSIIKIKKLKGRKIIYQNRTVVLLEKELAPFSFLNIIYLSENYFKDRKIDERIFLHEEIHVKQKHSFDVLFIEIFKAFSWFNPFIYLYKNAMITNHEFLADDEVIIKNENIKNYQELILNEVLKQQNLNLTHQFNFNNTKKRFIMMTKRNSKFAKAKKYLAIPAFAFLAVLFAEKVYANESTKNSQQEKPNEFDKVISLSDRKKLNELYFQLTKEQRDKTPLYFFNTLKKFEKIKVTQSELNDFTDGKKYGLWIDGKKTKNQDLKKYKPEDFSHYFVSKRYPNAISAKNPEPFQLNMMTDAYYQEYLKKGEKVFIGFKVLGKDTITPRKNMDIKVSEVKSSTTNLNDDKVQDLAISPAVNITQEVTTVPEYPGGINAMRNKISQNFNGAVFKGDEGLVRSNITFTIDEKGDVSNIKTMGNNEVFNNEAYRVVKLANENIIWKPATKDGKPVKYIFKIPLAMTFESTKKTQ